LLSRRKSPHCRCWEDANIAYTVRKKRQEFLNKNKGKSEIKKAVKTSYV
jgi:hypothetical protein